MSGGSVSILIMYFFGIVAYSRHDPGTVAHDPGTVDARRHKTSAQKAQKVKRDGLACELFYHLKKALFCVPSERSSDERHKRREDKQAQKRRANKRQ